jgi:parallel beta-helix repeat protein
MKKRNGIEKLGLALAIVAFMLVLMPSVHADDFYCVNCSDCNVKIQTANPGDVVTLTADITNCNGDCIELGGKYGITFDGGGHVIDGTGNVGDTGLYLSANSNDNTIKNCTIREFDTGIEIAHSRDNTVTDVVSKDNNNGGIYLNYADYNDLTNVSASWNKYFGNTYGFKLRYSDYNNLTNVTAEDTKGSSAYGGFYVEHSNYNNFTDLIASDNNKYGIYIYWDSNDNKIRNATITTNEGQGGLYVYSHSGQSTKNDIDTSNTINGKPIQFFDGYYKSCPNDQFLDYNDTYSLIHFYNGNNITLYATTLEDSVFLWSTHNSKIYDVNASHGLDGIKIWYSNSNIFTNITTSHNSHDGFYARYSYHNNFIDITSSYNNYYGFELWNFDYNVFTNVIASNNDDDGFYIRYGNHNTFTNITSSNNNDNGIEFVFDTDHNTVNNSHIERNSGAGVYFYVSNADDNLFYNNYLDNANNFGSGGTVHTNNWNTSKRLSTNIINGSYLGGNYWATPSGTGFSETCTDTNDDGICDNSYNLATNNIDHLPLAKPEVSPRTIYVNETGWWIEHDQFNPSSAPIQSAIDNATAGDTIFVKNGTYTENVDVDKSLTIRSENGPENCTVNAANPGDSVFELIVGAGNTNLSGFTVSGAMDTNSAGICLVGVSHCNISCNIVSGNNKGILVFEGADNNKLINNIVTSNSGDGIHIQSSGMNLIYNNYFDNTNNAQDGGTNVWNTTKEWGTNIIGGSFIGGNYWSDYAGVDNNGDGLGDTMRPYNSSGNIQQGGDWHPLVDVATSLPDLKITDVWICWSDNCTICYNVTNVGIGTAALAGHKTLLLVDGTEEAYDCVTEGVAPNESYIGCFDDYNWIYTPSGDNITVCADCNNTVSESNESNNCLNETWKCGDVNGDGIVSMSDALAIVSENIATSEWAADVNHDHVVSMSDALAIVSENINCCCE